MSCLWGEAGRGCAWNIDYVWFRIPGLMAVCDSGRGRGRKVVVMIVECKKRGADGPEVRGPADGYTH